MGRSSSIALGFEASVFFSMVATFVVAALILRRRKGEEGGAASQASQASQAASSRFRLGAVFFHPLTQFFVTCFVIWVNQIVFSAFTLKVHGGDPTFLKRYLGHGWCAVDVHDPLVRYVASFISAKGEHPILLLSALRVQAFLELPFTIFAYLSVTRMLSASLYRRLATSLPIMLLVGLFFTAPFCLAELALANPWTTDDLIIRLVAAFVVPTFVCFVARRELPATSNVTNTDPRPTAFGLLTFLAGAGAIAVIVLALYDAFLLYNLAHLTRYSSEIIVSVLLAILASFLSPRIDSIASRLIRPSTPMGSRSSAMAAIQNALVLFTALFFVPSLSIRYAAMYSVAQVSGVLLISIGLLSGMIHVAKRSTHPIRTAVSIILGFAAACLGGIYAAMTSDLTNELVIARVAIGFLVPLIAVTRSTEVALNILLDSPPPRRSSIA